jgi:outer membrane protein OmpA-like peptidoglycan-associated protein
MNSPFKQTLFQRSALAIATLATLAACSSVPERNAALDLARSRFDAAQAQTQVASLAAEELKRAGEALRKAEAAQKDGQSIAHVDHLAYLASQQVVVAQDTASSRAAQAVTASAGAERDRMRLALRTQEADNAKQQLASSERSNVRTTQELASAQQSNAMQASQLAAAAAGAQDDQARLARREAQVQELQAQMNALNARKTERGMVVTLGDVLFSTGQSRLQGDGDRTMDKLAEFLRRYPQRTAAIEGYTDSVGSESSNQALSDRRANAVMDALVGLGVPGNRLRSRGFGEARPVASNDTAEGRQMNRRVELVFAPEEGDAMLK